MEKNIKIRLMEENDYHYIEINESQLNLLKWLYTKHFFRSDVDYEIMDDIQYTII